MRVRVIILLRVVLGYAEVEFRVVDEIVAQLRWRLIAVFFRRVQGRGLDDGGLVRHGRGHLRYAGRQGGEILLCAYIRVLCDGLDILEGAADTADTAHGASGLGDLGDLAVGGFRVTDAKLGDSAQLAGHPGGEDFATLLLAKAGSGEIAFGDEGDNVEDDLVSVEDGIDDDGDDGGEVGFSEDFDKDDNETTGLEDGTDLG